MSDKIRIRVPDGPTAELDDGGAWSSQDVEFAGMLNSLFGPDAYPPTPAAGAIMFSAQAREAARRLGAEIDWPETDGEDPDTTEGRVY